MSELRGILVVDDEKDFAAGLVWLLASRFKSEPVAAVHTGEEALARQAEQAPAVLLTDMRMPSMSGLQLLRTALERQPHTSLVLLTAFGSIETAVQALKAGAYDFLTKPIEPEALFKVVAKGLERTRLLNENTRLKELLAGQGTGPRLIGESPAMRRTRDAIAAVADSDYTVLIRGESGTGKELAAHTIHALSSRRDRPLVSVNCPAIPEQLLESELFGHVKGAFTGADRERKGLFLNAQRGTLLLDEIGDISQVLQTKLLRCLQEQEIRPVGSSKSIAVDVRILASTNQDLEARMAERSFREDLYYRLNVLTISMPPLRERREDIPLLAHHFLSQTCAEMHVNPKDVTPEALAALSARPWPGNVRELLNFMRRLAVFAPGETVELGHVRAAGQRTAGPGNCREPGNNGVPPYKDAKAAVLDDFIRCYATELLKTTGGNVSEAARVSGLTRVALQKILKRLDIDADGFRH